MITGHQVFIHNFQNIRIRLLQKLNMRVNRALTICILRRKMHGKAGRNSIRLFSSDRPYYTFSFCHVPSPLSCLYSLTLRRFLFQRSSSSTDPSISPGLHNINPIFRYHMSKNRLLHGLFLLFSLCFLMIIVSGTQLADK